MIGGRALSDAFYRHPAFIPHVILNQAGVRRFWLRNTLITGLSVIALFLCSWIDDSIFLDDRGYGFLEHPGIFGWFLIQLFMPIAIHQTVKRALTARHHYQRLAKSSDKILFNENLYTPLLAFIALRTEPSRRFFSLLFTIGFGGFAWNTYHNIFPGKLAPLDFWDSITFSWGYFGTRLYKFYIDALLLPSVVHIFSGIVWFHTRYLRSLARSKLIRLLPFSPDRAGGMGFLSELILSPAITALLVSGVAFFGVIYTHRSFEFTVGLGLTIEVSILLFFYIIPTLLIRGTIKRLQYDELSELYESLAGHYKTMIGGGLRGKALKEACENSQYCKDIIERIDRIPKWPHIAKISGAFGLSITPALVMSAGGLISQWAAFYLNRS